MLGGSQAGVYECVLFINDGRRMTKIRMLEHHYHRRTFHHSFSKLLHRSVCGSVDHYSEASTLFWDVGDGKLILYT